jgi:hypothetical protein
LSRENDSIVPFMRGVLRWLFEVAAVKAYAASAPRMLDTSTISRRPNDDRPVANTRGFDESVQCRGAAATLHNEQPHLALNRGMVLSVERCGMCSGANITPRRQNPIDAIWE